MLFEIKQEIAARLRNLPVTVSYGSERFDQNYPSGNRIEIRHMGPESWGPPKTTQNGVAPIVWTRWIGVGVVIEARSNVGGTKEIDHQREMDVLLHAFMSALRVTCERRRIEVRNWSADSPGLLLQGDEDMVNGAIYELTFQLSMAIPLADSLASVDASTLTARGSTTVTQGTQVQVACQAEPDP